MFFVSTVPWLLLLGMTSYGLKGGSGSLLFTGVFTYLFGFVIQYLLAAPIQQIAVTPSHTGLIQAILFLVLLGVAFPLGSFANRFVQMNFDPFDWLLGGIFGIGAAVVAVHFFLMFSLAAHEGTVVYGTVKQMFLVRQLVYFDGWNHMIQVVTNLYNSGRVRP